MENFLSSVRRGVSKKDIEILEESLYWVEVTVKREEGRQEDMTPPTPNVFPPHILNVYNSSWKIKYWVGNEEFGSTMAASSGSSLQINSGGEFENSNIDNAALTGITMVHYANMKKWPGLIIIDGNKFMKWLIWAACQEYGLECHGFDPDEDDHSRKDRCKHMLSEFKSAKEINFDFAPVGLSAGGGSSQSDLEE